MISIRAATPDDIEVLAALEVASFEEAWTREGIETSLHDDKYVMLVACDEYSVAGYASGWSIGEEAEIARLAIFENQRGRGLGEVLTRALMEEFFGRGARGIFLEVRETNVAARRLYARMDFKEVGKRPNYYAGGEAAILMRRRL